MPNTLSQIRSLCRRRLDDLTAPYTFSDLQVNQWINDALAEVSKALPRLLEIEVEADGTANSFALPAGCRAIVSVEYPIDQTPPRYLSRLDLRQPGFSEAAVYDWLPSNSLSEADRLLLGQPPADGDKLRLRYLAAHEWLDGDLDECSLPDEHLELLVLFVRWAAWQALATQEAANPDPGSASRSELEGNVRRAGEAFQEALASSVKASASSRVSAWAALAQGRIY